MLNPGTLTNPRFVIVKKSVVETLSNLGLILEHIINLAEIPILSICTQQNYREE